MPSSVCIRNRRPPRSTHFPPTALSRSGPTDTSPSAIVPAQPASARQRRRRSRWAVTSARTDQLTVVPKATSSVLATAVCGPVRVRWTDRKSTRLNSSHANISYAVFCLYKKPPPPEIYTLPTHGALPIWADRHLAERDRPGRAGQRPPAAAAQQVGGDQRAHRPVDGGAEGDVERPGHGGLRPGARALDRSEEHTSELQSRQYLVCRLLFV